MRRAHNPVRVSSPWAPSSERRASLASPREPTGSEPASERPSSSTCSSETGRAARDRGNSGHEVRHAACGSDRRQPRRVRRLAIELQPLHACTSLANISAHAGCPMATAKREQVRLIVAHASRAPVKPAHVVCRDLSSSGLDSLCARALSSPPALLVQPLPHPAALLPLKVKPPRTRPPAPPPRHCKRYAICRRPAAPTSRGRSGALARPLADGPCQSCHACVHHSTLGRVTRGGRGEGGTARLPGESVGGYASGGGGVQTPIAPAPPFQTGSHDPCRPCAAPGRAKMGLRYAREGAGSFLGGALKSATAGPGPRRLRAPQLAISTRFERPGASRRALGCTVPETHQQLPGRASSARRTPACRSPGSRRRPHSARPTPKPGPALAAVCPLSVPKRSSPTRALPARSWLLLGGPRPRHRPRLRHPESWRRRGASQDVSAQTKPVRLSWWTAERPLPLGLCGARLRRPAARCVPGKARGRVRPAPNYLGSGRAADRAAGRTTDALARARRAGRGLAAAACC